MGDKLTAAELIAAHQTLYRLACERELTAMEATLLQHALGLVADYALRLQIRARA